MSEQSAEAAKTGGRPKKPIDPDQVKALAAIGCTLEEMCTVLKCSVRTLQRRRFDALIKAGQLEAKASLRRWQYDKAKGGSAAMQIWLGKQWLGQKDKHELTGANDGPVQTEHHGYSDDRLNAEVERLGEAIRVLEGPAAVGDEVASRLPPQGEGAAAGEVVADGVRAAHVPEVRGELAPPADL